MPSISRTSKADCGNGLTDINDTSPTCFQEVTQQMGCDVAALFSDALERAVASKA